MADSQRDIVIKIETKTTQAVNDIKKLNREIDKLNKKNKDFQKTTTQVNQMTRSFASLATHLGRLALIYGAFQGLQNTVRTFAEFEQAITRLGVISGATEEELASLEQRAKDLGESTIYSASQVADGMNAMAMAGLDAGQQLDGIGAVLNVATVGMIGLEEASLITVRAMGAFALEAQDIGMITDVMATGATDSAQTIAQLGNAYEKVGSVATSFNLSLQETTSALEVMADAGRVGAEAGTQLKIVLLRLGANKEAKKYIEELTSSIDGSSISMYDASGNLKSFKDQLLTLKDGLSGLGEEAQKLKLAQIVGSEAVASTLVLINNLDKYDEKLKNVNNSYDSARVKSQELQATLVGSWKELQSALEGLSIKLGTTLAPALENIIDDATLFIQTLSKAEIAKFGEDVAKLAESVGTFATALVTMFDIFSGYAGIFKEYTTVSIGWVAVLGAIIVKLRGVKLGLMALGLANPVLATLTAGLLALDIALIALDATTKKYTALMQGNAIAMNMARDATQEYGDVSKTLKLTEIAKGQKVLTSALTVVERQLVANKERILELNTAWFADRKKKAEELRTLANYNAILEESVVTLKSNQVAHTERGKVLTQLRIDELKGLGLAGTKLDDLSKKQIASLDKTIAGMVTRRVALEKTLGTMYGKEKKYRDDIAKLEQEKADIRKKYGDERESAEFSLETRIANVKAMGLNDLQKYNDAQRRSDEVLAKAKEAFAKGNLEMAKTYLAEYDSLISISAGEEIKVKDKVKKTAQATALELEKDAKNGHKLLIDIINEQEKRDIEATNAKMAVKQLELKMLLLNIKLQNQLIGLTADAIEGASKVKFGVQYDEFQTDIDNIEAEMTKVLQKQRNIKLGVAVDEGELKKVEGTPIEPEVDPDLKKAEIKMSGFRADSDEPIDITADLNTDEAKAKAKQLKIEVEVPVEKLVDLETSKAYMESDKFTAYASKSANKIIYVTYVPTNSPQGGYQTGGLITPLLPRFADGGDLDSGVGHSRKTGSLSGYGGGDKIKALLEKGEFIIRKEAVRALGLSRLNTINKGKLPRYNKGGGVSIPRFSTGGSTSNTKATNSMELNLNIGSQSFKTFTTEDVANALAIELKRMEF